MIKAEPRSIFPRPTVPLPASGDPLNHFAPVRLPPKHAVEPLADASTQLHPSHGASATNASTRPPPTHAAEPLTDASTQLRPSHGASAANASTRLPPRYALFAWPFEPAAQRLEQREPQQGGGGSSSSRDVVTLEGHVHSQAQASQTVASKHYGRTTAPAVTAGKPQTGNIPVSSPLL